MKYVLRALAVFVVMPPLTAFAALTKLAAGPLLSHLWLAAASIMAWALIRKAIP